MITQTATWEKVTMDNSDIRSGPKKKKRSSVWHADTSKIGATFLSDRVLIYVAISRPMCTKDQLPSQGH